MASELTVGKIGVGAAPSTYQLDVTTTGNNGIRTNNGTAQVYMGSTGGAAAIGTLNDNSLNVITNGTTCLTISSAGLATFANDIDVNGVDSRPGGMKVFSMTITEGVTTTFFNPSDLDGVWSGMIEMHAKSHNDTNRSSYQQLVFRYDNAFTALQSSNLNLTPTFSYVAGAGAAQGMRVSFAGGGYGQSIDCVFRIIGSHNS